MSASAAARTDGAERAPRSKSPARPDTEIAPTSAPEGEKTGLATAATVVGELSDLHGEAAPPDVGELDASDARDR